MQVSVLASGSKGNATFIEMDGTRILVDAGISARRIKNALADISVDVASLDGIFITHEHRDHIGGLKTLSKQYHLPIFTRAATFRNMFCAKDIPADCFNEIGNGVQLGGLRIDAFNISHDAADPVGYAVKGSTKCTVATDLGFVTSNVQAAIEESELLVLEANHDSDMLRNGKYPWALKQRIMSNRGHLSNTDAAWTLARMKCKPDKVLLAHLSEENNKPETAIDTVLDILIKQGYPDAKEHVLLTSQEQPVHVAI